MVDRRSGDKRRVIAGWLDAAAGALGVAVSVLALALVGYIVG